jgi:hypothetical protein
VRGDAFGDLAVEVLSAYLNPVMDVRQLRVALMDFQSHGLPAHEPDHET